MKGSMTFIRMTLSKTTISVNVLAIEIKNKALNITLSTQYHYVDFAFAGSCFYFLSVILVNVVISSVVVPFEILNSNLFFQCLTLFWTGNTYRRGRLSTVDLLIKIVCSNS